MRCTWITVEMFSVTRRLEIEWGQCDPAGIVYYPQFLSMFDWSTMKLFQKALGMTKHEMMSTFDCGGIPIVKLETIFRKPCRFADIVDIESTMLKVGRTSFQIRHALTKGHELCVECKQVRVWVAHSPDDRTKIQPIPIPAQVAECFTNSMANAVLRID
jgi:4-hydroxybenzoyl-CoA thioesterase